MCKVQGYDGYMYEPVWINQQDVAARDINDGDIVKIYNEREATLGGARVTERIIPSAVSKLHKCWRRGRVELHLKHDISLVGLEV